MNQDIFLGALEYFEKLKDYSFSVKAIDKLRYFEISSLNMDKLINDLP
jgi:hypothetical protein